MSTTKTDAVKTPKKVMKTEHKYTERQSKLIEEFGTSFTLGDDHVADLPGFKETVMGHVDPKFTQDDLNELSGVFKDVGVALAATVGRGFAEHMIDHDDVASLELRLEGPLYDHGVSAARPTQKKPTRRHYENSVTTYVRVKCDPLELEVKNSLADLWD